jgi:hypothetical protein
LRELIGIPEPNFEKENEFKQQIEDIKDEFKRTKDELIKDVQELLKNFAKASDDKGKINE